MGDGVRAKSALILFAREPVRGRVKTRLELALGKDGAHSLYRQLLRRQMSLVCDYPGVDTWLAVDGNPAHPEFQSFSGRRILQQGPDIGQRMGNALAQALEGSEAAVLIGCDSPDISASYLDKAFSALNSGADVVLGPAHDGGYVLIGMKKAEAALFDDMPWGRNSVMDKTRERLSALGLDWQELVPVHDIDEAGDLVHLEGGGMEC